MRSPIHDSSPLHSLLADIRDARFSHGVRCPRCAHHRIQRWGSFGCRQRYRCLGCRRTFSDLTGTPAAYSKKLDRWPAYGRCVRAAVPVRDAAALVGIHTSTAFRWRHAILGYMKSQDAETLSGWVELATMWFAYSEKGRRDLQREPRLHGGRVPLAAPIVHVVVACDRNAGVVSSLTSISPTRMVDGGELRPTLTNRVATGVMLIARQRPAGHASRLALAVGGTYHATGAPTRGVDALFVHVSTALAYRKRFRDWHKRFRGVATRYLSNYLVWHRLVDRAIRYDLARSALQWPIGESTFCARCDVMHRLEATLASQQFPRTQHDGGETRSKWLPGADLTLSDIARPPRSPPTFLN
jgi:transposase-like protein